MFGQKVVDMLPWLTRGKDSSAKSTDAAETPVAAETAVEATAAKDETALGQMNVSAFEQLLTRVEVAKKVAAVREHHAGVNRNRVRRLFRSLGLLAAVAIGVFAFSSDDAKEKLPVEKVPLVGASLPVVAALPGATHTGHIAVIKLNGEIDGALHDVPSASNTPLYLDTALTEAEKDPDLAGVILEIDSPGGSAVASEEAYRVVKHARERLLKRHVRIVAYTSTGAYSGGYYIAMGVGQGNFFADPGASVANIGVISRYYNTAGLGELLGVTENIIKSGPLKSTGAQWEKMTPDQRAMLQEENHDDFTSFLEAVSESRQIDMATLIRESQLPQGISNGGWFSAKRALKLKLIDRIIPVEDLYNTAAESLPDPKKFKKVEFIEYRVEPDVLEKGTKKAGHAIGTFLRIVISEMTHRDAPLRSERE